MQTESMSNAITTLKPVCYLSYKTCSLPVRKHHYQLFGNYQSSHPLNIKFKVHLSYVPFIRANGNSEDSDEEAPTPRKSHFSAWKKWAAGLMLSLILPSYRHKMGPFLLLKTKVDAAVETVETVVDVVEDLAEAVEKLADEVGNRLPEDAKFKETAQLVEDLARQADEKAEQAQDIIQQVKAAGEELEEMIGWRRDDDKDQPSKKISQH